MNRNGTRKYLLTFLSSESNIRLSGNPVAFNAMLVDFPFICESVNFVVSVEDFSLFV
jgi:hypothetical protein